MKPWDARSAAAAGRDSFSACVGAILELGPDELPALEGGGDPAALGVVNRWLGGLGLGIARVAHPARFTWAGPWIARVQPPGADAGRFVVMFGVPSGVVWDPAGDGEVDNEWIAEGHLVAAGDISLARPALPAAPLQTGRVERIWISPNAGAPARAREAARALPGRGLEGDRHVTGDGTFPSGLPGSALTLIEAEVCESFAPPLAPDEHRRNVVTRGIALKGRGSRT